MGLFKEIGNFFCPKKLSSEEEQTRRVAEQEQKAQKGKNSAERAVGRLGEMQKQDRIAESEEQVSSNQNQETKKDPQQQNRAA